MRRSIEEIAREYAILDIDHDSWGVDQKPELRHHLWDLRQEMEGRCGDEHTIAHIRRAEELLEMMGAKRKSTRVKWLAGLQLYQPKSVTLISDT